MFTLTMWLEGVRPAVGRVAARLASSVALAAVAAVVLPWSSIGGLRPRVVEPPRRAPVGIRTPVAGLGRDSLSHPGGLYTQRQFDFVKGQIQARQQPWSDAFDQLMASANRLRNWQPHTVAVYVTPGFYKDRAAFFAATNAITHDADAAYVNAFAYRLSGDPSYADCTVRVLRAWARDNKGVATTDDSQLSMAEVGTGFIESAELLSGYSGWSEADRSAFRNWVRNVYLPQGANPIKDRTNNWGEWGSFGAVTADYYLDDATGLADETARLQRHIDQALAPNGTMPDETARGEAGAWYTYFALAPMTAAARVIENSGGPDLFRWSSPSGKRMKSALDLLLAVMQDPTKWPISVKVNLPNPARDWWPYDLFEAMADEYSDKQYDAFAAQRRPIMNTGHHHAWTLPTLMKSPHGS